MQGAANQTGDQSQQERELAQRRKGRQVRKGKFNRRLAQINADVGILFIREAR